MKKFCSVILTAICCVSGFAQSTVFSDDFESGTSAWTLTGQWGTTTSQAYNGSYSFADSPSGLYQNNQTTYATITNSFDLSSALDANVHFRLKFDIENGFDYCYLEMSNNNGSSWTTVYTFNGENNLNTWTNFSVSAGGFVSYSQVKLRFRFYTDAAYQSDGIFIDSFRIVSDTVDNAPPLIVHDPDPHFEGQPGINYRDVTITDISGVASATLTYEVDNGSPQTITPVDTNGNVYTFAIPAQDAGAYVEYFINATDSSLQANATVSDIYEYIAGNYIKHDNGTVSTITSFNSSGFYTGAANRITLNGFSTLTTALIRNYTDYNNPNDSIEIHVWSDNNGNPGTDLITPFIVFPEANLLEPQRMTRVDLRPYEAQLDSLSGNVFVGFTVPSGTAWIVQTTGSNGRGKNYNGSTWGDATATYHFRAITNDPITVPDAYFVYDNSNDPVVQFTDSSSGNPTAWSWDFGDGGSDTVQHPSHTYASTGTYNVCLTATNFVGNSQQYCDQVTIVNSAPIALFIVNASNDPTIVIDEFSQNNPTSWYWEFGDGDTSTQQEPTHTYDSPGGYAVCLVASNAYGSDTACQNITIVNQLPIPLFTYQVFDENIVAFENLSAPGVPTTTDYKWYFGSNNDSSDAFEPTYNYPNSGGTFEVCLVASNTVGSSSPYCADVDLDDLTIGINERYNGNVVLVPNPATDVLYVRIGEDMETPHSLRMIALDGSIIDVIGAPVNHGWQLDVASLAGGVYFIEITGSDGYLQRIPVVIR